MFSHADFSYHGYVQPLYAQWNDMSLCPCQSGKEYDACCGPLIGGRAAAATAESLMRSRYSAFATGEIEYLKRSLHPDHRADFDPASTQALSANSQWLGLEIVTISGGGKDDEHGAVEFIATFRQNGMTFKHHELGEFSRYDGIWYYTDGKLVAPDA